MVPVDHLLSPYRPDLGAPSTFLHGPPHRYWNVRPDVEYVASQELDTSFWSVTGWSLAKQVLGESETFTSRYGMMLGFGIQNPDGGGEQMLVVSEGDKHRRLRSIMRDYFSTHYVRELSPLLRSDLDSFLGEHLDSTSFDFTSTMARQIPMRVISRILGVEAADWEYLYALSGAIFSDHTDNGSAGTARRAATAAHSEILAFFQTLVDKRRVIPENDLVSHMLRGVAAGTLDEVDVIMGCDNVLIGGNETTRHSLTGAVLALARYSDQWSTLRQTPQCLSTAVEEVLRWTSPVMHVLRTATIPTHLGGSAIEPGQSVVVWLTAANRDGRTFDRPDVFDIAREPNRHLALGHGVHHCLGANLARLEVRLLLDLLARRVQSIEVVSAPTWLPSTFVSGYRRAEVLFTPA